MTRLAAFFHSETTESLSEIRAKRVTCVPLAPRNFAKFSRRARSRVLDPDRSMNRPNQSTIQPRASSVAVGAILSILSIFRPARPRSKTAHDSRLVRFLPCLPLAHESSPFSFIAASRLLSVHLPFYGLRRDDVAPRNAWHVGTGSVSRRKHRHHWRSQRGVNNRGKTGEDATERRKIHISAKM